MAREKIEVLMNFDAADNRQRAAKACYQARGICAFSITPRRPPKSQKQLGYYFGVICDMFCDFLKANGTEDANLEYAHCLLKDKWLKAETVIPTTGEVVQWTRSVADLKTLEMTQYVENCRMWLAEIGVETPDPDPYYSDAPSKGVAVAS